MKYMKSEMGILSNGKKKKYYENAKVCAKKTMKGRMAWVNI